MRKNQHRNQSKAAKLCLITIAVISLTSCMVRQDSLQNLIMDEEMKTDVVNLFGPMEKSIPNGVNTARSAFDMTIFAAEEKWNLSVEYRTYTAENYQEKTYDDVTLDRVRNRMDDLYLLNPDTIQILGAEGRLLDLSILESAKNLRDVVKMANTVDGKLVAIPQEIVVHGLFVNQDMFEQYNLELPHTPEEFLECCRVFKENGIETPVGANRWWLENFVFALAYADLYNGGTAEEEIEALNCGEKKYSDYLRPGFMFLKELMDKGYVDAETAYTYEAIEGEGPDFLAQKTPIVMAYWGAANTVTAYGAPDFTMKVIGFPSSRGQMPVISMTGYGIVADAENRENTIKVLDSILSDESLQVYSEKNRVISPSKNVEVECIPALQPLNNRVKENIYVLGSNAGMKLEQWGNVCILVRNLMSGATVDECMEELDRLQEETLK